MFTKTPMNTCSLHPLACESYDLGICAVWYRLAQRLLCHNGSVCLRLCFNVVCLAALSSHLCHDLYVKPLSPKSWANTQGWEVNWKQDVATACMYGGDRLLTQLLDWWSRCRPVNTHTHTKSETSYIHCVQLPVKTNMSTTELNQHLSVKNVYYNPNKHSIAS